MSRKMPKLNLQNIKKVLEHFYLTEDEKYIFKQIYVEDKSIGFVASCMNLSESALNARISKLKSKVIEIINE